MSALMKCPCEGETLDRLAQPAALAVLAEGPLHGYRLAERIAELLPCRPEQPDVSGVYRFLKGMERRGLVASAWDLSAAGPARRRYRLTVEGRECLARWIETLEEYRSQIEGLLVEARRVLPRSRPAQRRSKVGRAAVATPAPCPPGCCSPAKGSRP